MEFVDGMSLYRGYLAIDRIDPSGLKEFDSRNCGRIAKEIGAVYFDWNFARKVAITVNAGLRVVGGICSVCCRDGSQENDWKVGVEGAGRIEVSFMPWGFSIYDAVSGLSGAGWVGLKVFGAVELSAFGGGKSDKCNGDLGTGVACVEGAGEFGVSGGGSMHLNYNGGIWGGKVRLFTLEAFATGKIFISYERCYTIESGPTLKYKSTTGCVGYSINARFEAPFKFISTWDFTMFSHERCFDLS